MQLCFPLKAAVSQPVQQKYYESKHVLFNLSIYAKVKLPPLYYVTGNNVSFQIELQMSSWQCNWHLNWRKINRQGGWEGQVYFNNRNRCFITCSSSQSWRSSILWLSKNTLVVLCVSCTVDGASGVYWSRLRSNCKSCFICSVSNILFLPSWSCWLLIMKFCRTEAGQQLSYSVIRQTGQMRMGKSLKST